MRTASLLLVALVLAFTCLARFSAAVVPSTGAASPEATLGAPAAIGSADCAGADASWLEAATGNLARAEYTPSASPGGLQAPNRVHNLRTYFGEQGIEIRPRTAAQQAISLTDFSWRFTWKTTGMGRPDRMTGASTVPPRIEDSRVVYLREGWTEWYENKPEGLEQGFTLDRRPVGDGPLQISGAIPGLEPRLQSDGGIDLFDEHGARVLRYGDLHVWDGRGTELAAHLEIVGSDRVPDDGDPELSELLIVIDDGGAEYPITIDPLVTSPSWTTESNQSSSFLGISVSTAGDVNGDGFSDVIVGAWLYDNGQTDEGRAFVYHGSPSGLTFNPAWTAESDQADAHFGFSVATAGDVNGDGYDDVIVGAFQYDNGQSEEGRAFVYLGSPNGLSATANWTAESDQAGAEFGTLVAAAGDVDGDGFADVVVGAPFFDNGESNEGRAFVFHGSSGGLSLAPQWTGESDWANAQFGRSAATAGDVNGDGFADLVVGAANYTNGEINEGRAFLYKGAAAGLSVASSWAVESNQASAYFGVSVAGAGDVNGDGYADVIIGAQGYSNDQTNEGAVFVYHGSAGGLSTTFAWLGEGDQSDSSYGHSVATAGDVNGDGYADVIVGAMNFANGQFTEGRAIVHLGSRLGVEPLKYWTVESNQIGANLGISVATAGDVNGDGYSDVLVGAWRFDAGQTDEGRAFVYHGSAGGPMVVPQWIATGEQHSASFGRSVSTAGDVNGDGYSDVIVGACFYDNGQHNEGRVFVFHGSAAGLEFAPAWTAESNQADALMGWSVATAGDVNGDGYSDVVVGARNYDGGQIDEGRAYLYHGSPNGLSVTPDWIAESDQDAGLFGSSVATAGDVNGDGYSDVIIGRPGVLFSSFAPAAYVYHGSPAGLSLTADWIEESDVQDSAFGMSVSTAGDVNGDGFSDVIVGAPGFDDEAARAFVYHGSATGLSATPDWTAEISQSDGGAFVQSVSTAGDVNGDGYSDVIVGVPTNQGFRGRAEIFHGSPAGLGIANWVAVGETNSSTFGISVGTAGDVNGDGFSDVIIGASGYEDGGATNEGRVYVYYGSSIGTDAGPAWLLESNHFGAQMGQSVGTAGDVNGDGFSDVIVGLPGYEIDEPNEGMAEAILGNDRRGLDRLPRQARTDDSAPISLLGMSDSPSSFRLKALGRTAAGRGRVRMQFEVKPLGVPFDGVGIQSGERVDTGAPMSGAGSSVPLSELATGLASETLYHWRLRIAADSPFFPRTAWMGMPFNASTEADLRTGSGTAAIPDEELQSLRGSLLEPIRPNPFTGVGEIAFTLPVAAEARLVVLDVAGRERAVVTEGMLQAGRQIVRWDGRDALGTKLPSGVYLLRLEFDGRSESRKLVLTR